MFCKKTLGESVLNTIPPQLKYFPRRENVLKIIPPFGGHVLKTLPPLLGNVLEPPVE